MCQSAVFRHCHRKHRYEQKTHLTQQNISIWEKYRNFITNITKNRRRVEIIRRREEKPMGRRKNICFIYIIYRAVLLYSSRLDFKRQTCIVFYVWVASSYYIYLICRALSRYSREITSKNRTLPKLPLGIFIPNQ